MHSSASGSSLRGVLSMSLEEGSLLGRRNSLPGTWTGTGGDGEGSQPSTGGIFLPVRSFEGSRSGPGRADRYCDETQFCPEGSFREDGDEAGLAMAAGCRRYQTCGECNRGSMGIIYKGYDTWLGREVALKFLHRKFCGNPELRDLFIHEAKITSRLQHPGVVPIYDLHQGEGNILFFTMEFVDGQTLKELLAGRDYHFHDLPEYLSVFERVCQTVAYAHSQGVIHRDLKPANVMVGKFGVVRVMDWGLAKVLEDPSGHSPGLEREVLCARRGLNGGVPQRQEAENPETVPAPGRVMGTFAYMAPEQARGETGRLDKRTDVFGLGAMLCEILTGRPPYQGRNPEELYHMAAEARLDGAMTGLDRCLADPWLVQLAKQCLHPDPGDRPGSAGWVANALKAQIESDLKRSALDLARFFELSPDIFCLASLDGFFQRVNANFSRVLGFTKAELVSRPFLDFVHPDDVPQTVEQVEKLALGLPVVRFRNRYRDVTGGYRWFEWTAKAIPEEKVIFAIARTDDPDPAPTS